MATSLGALVVSLGLDAAQFTQGLSRAEYQARQFGEKLGAGLRSAGTLAVGGLAAVGAAAVAAGVAFDSLVKQAGDFQDLAEKTGGSAEGLASLAVAAGTAGVSMDAIAGASVKLTKNLTGVDDESKDAGAALKALGINIEQFKALKPEDQMVSLANALGQFEDGAGKTAVATALLGKAGADALPFLKALEEQGGKQVILTAEMIAQADEYSDKQAKAKAELNLYAQALATQALPAVTAFTGALTDTIKEMLGTENAAKDLASSNAVATFAENAVRALGFVVDAVDGVIRVFEGVGKTIGAAAAQVAAIASGEFKQASQIGKEWAADMQAIANRPLFSSKLDARLAQQKADAAAAAGVVGAPKPTLNFQGATKKGGGGGDDPTKKLLDNELKALENAANEERDILASRNKMLDLYNGAALISTQDYYAGRRAAAEEAVAAQAAIYDQEIAALQAFQAKAAKATDRESAQGKINDLLAKKAKLYRDAAEAAVESSFKEQKSAEDLARMLGEVNAQVLELQGNLVEAANIRFDLQNAEKLKRFMAEGNDEAVKQLDYLKQISAAQAQLNQVQESFGRTKSDLQRAEERIARDQQNGTLGTIEGLKKLGQAREQALNGMKMAFSEFQALEANGVQLTAKQRETMKELAFQIEDLSTQLDPLGQKFNQTFSDGFANAFGSIIDGTKSVKQAFKDMVNSIVSDFVKMAAQDVFKSFFSGGGSATGGVGFNLGSWLSALFGAASGGMLMPGEMRRVNENGPELLDVNGKQYLMNGSRNATVTSNGKIGSAGGSSYISITVPGNTDSRTANQIADRLSLQQRQGRRYA